MIEYVIIPLILGQHGNTRLLKQVLANWCSQNLMLILSFNKYFYIFSKSRWVIITNSLGVAKSLQDWITTKNFFLDCWVLSLNLFLLCILQLLVDLFFCRLLLLMTTTNFLTYLGQKLHRIFRIFGFTCSWFPRYHYCLFFLIFEYRMVCHCCYTIYVGFAIA